MTYDDNTVPLHHRSVALLLAEHGTTTAGRAAARDALTADILTDAQKAATAAGRLLACTIDNHSVCADDGHRCLCECHDPTGGDDT